MPTRAGTRMLEASRSFDGTFDIDAFHVMDRRDNALIEDELLHGAVSRRFVYRFKIQDTEVTGISVIGARHLAAQYGGLKHRIVASVSKNGTMFTFMSYPQPGMPMSVSCSTVPELGDEPDFYSAIVEVQDIKTGNSVQMESQESRFAARRDGSLYERPHFAKIAQAKAYRNAILSLIPQDAQLQWKARALELGENVVLTQDVLQEKRDGVLRYAAQHGIPIARPALAAIGFDQISGLADSARAGSLPAFRASLASLGLTASQDTAELAPPASPPPPARTTREPPAQDSRQQPPGGGGTPPPAPPPAEEAGEPSGPASSPGTARAGFRATLLDREGHTIDGFDDPVKFADALIELVNSGFPGDQDAVIFQNELVMAEACVLSPRAAELLGPYMPAVDAGEVPMPRLRSGAGDMTGYVQAVQERVLRLPADRMTAFVAANVERWRSLPKPRQLEVERAVSLRCQGLGVPVPELFSDAAAPGIPGGTAP